MMRKRINLRTRHFDTKQSESFARKLTVEGHRQDEVIENNFEAKTKL